jgi:hypothetical protein
MMFTDGKIFTELTAIRFYTLDVCSPIIFDDQGGALAAFIEIMKIVRKKPFPLSSVSIGLGVILPPTPVSRCGSEECSFGCKACVVPGRKRKGTAFGSKAPSRSAPFSSPAPRWSVSPTPSSSPSPNKSSRLRGRGPFFAQSGGGSPDARINSSSVLRAKGPINTDLPHRSH